MSKMKKDVFSEAIVGLFMVVVLALLAYFTIVISGVDVLSGNKKVAMHVTFADIGGLKDRDNVVFRGMKVGTVDRVELAPGAIRLTLKVDPSVRMRERCRIAVTPLSFLGGYYLSLEEGTGELLPLSTTEFAGEPPSDWMRDLGEIARRVKELTGDGAMKGILSNVQNAAESVRQVAERVERGEGTLGKLLSSDTALYDDLAATVGSARSTMTNLQHVAERVERGESMVGKLLSADDTVYDDFKVAVAEARASFADARAALANVAKFSENLNNTNSLAARITSDAELASDAAALVTRLKAAAGNLDAVSQRLAAGEGTLGKLAVDAELYNELNALMKDVRQIIDNYRDTTPITSFGSLIGGAL